MSTRMYYHILLTVNVIPTMFPQGLPCDTTQVSPGITLLHKYIYPTISYWEITRNSIKFRLSH